MIDIDEIDESTERLLAAQDRAERAPYAASYRATAACVREIARLADAVEAGATAAHADGRLDAPVVRRSPNRCIVQSGPVALTVAWLPRGGGTVADGELLLMVWRGAVAARSPRGFERTVERPGASQATAVWEEVRVVDATSELAWGWAAQGATDGAVDGSLALADRCLAHLCAAYAEGRSAH